MKKLLWLNPVFQNSCMNRVCEQRLPALDEIKTLFVAPLLQFPGQSGRLTQQSAADKRG